MLRSLFSGISGLRSHQTMMDVTGNNIANVNTTGYKAANTVFEDTLSQTLANASAPAGAKGGTNPDLKAFAAETHAIVERHLGELHARGADAR